MDSSDITWAWPMLFVDALRCGALVLAALPVMACGTATSEVPADAATRGGGDTTDAAGLPDSTLATAPTLQDGSVGYDASADASTPVSIASTTRVIPPSEWTCGLPDGIDGYDATQEVLSLDAVVGAIHDVGETPYGHRRILDLSSGTAAGDAIVGSLWKGGLEYELTLANGVREVEQVSIVLTDDGSAILMRSCGIGPSATGDVRMVFDFEAPVGGKYAFLNEGTFVGDRTLDEARQRLQVHVYFAARHDAGAEVVVGAPPAVPAQPWDCAIARGTPGAEVYASDVGTADGLILVGGSKRGTRNVIPITGGTMTGMIRGTVLRGGADFQLLKDDLSLELDARYTLRTEDGAYVIVRNCGALGQLVPRFETALGTPASWLNDGHFHSDDPGLGLDSVHIVVRRAE